MVVVVVVVVVVSFCSEEEEKDVESNLHDPETIEHPFKSAGFC